MAVEPVRLCKTCYWCQRGEYSACENFVTIGQMDDGGMAVMMRTRILPWEWLTAARGRAAAPASHAGEPGSTLLRN